MRAVSVVLLLLAGCFKPGYSDCEITCATNSCPSGLSCQSGYCRESGATGSCTGGGSNDSGVDPDVATADDRDGDGVPNDQDNCPDVANRFQENEDGDAKGNVCDPCPIDASANGDADGDGDGVGNSCDPFPNQATEKIFFFEGFSTSTSTATYIKCLTQPTIQQGQLRLEDPSNAQGCTAVWPAPTTGNITVFTQYTMDTANPPNGGAGPVQGFDMATMRGTFFRVGVDPGNLPMDELTDFPNGPVLQRRVFGGPSPIGMTVVSYLLRDVSGGYQGITTAEPQPQPIFATSQLPYPPQPQLGVRVVQGTARFDWVMVLLSQ